jgi:hypothetical protein
MTTWAWVFLFGAWAVIIGCMVYCFSKLLFSPRGLGEELSAVSPADRACPRCGALNVATADLCESCGASLSSGSLPATPTRPAEQ